MLTFCFLFRLRLTIFPKFYEFVMLQDTAGPQKSGDLHRNKKKAQRERPRESSKEHMYEISSKNREKTGVKTKNTLWWICPMNQPVQK